MTPPATYTEAAPCKVNLTLDVFPPRPDGFHDLDSIVVTFTPSDHVTLKIAPMTSGPTEIRLHCDDPTLPTDGRNLAFRAAHAFLQFRPFDTPVLIDIRLEKRLPHQAGLGGGSSDAAAVLRMLARAIPVAPDALNALGATIGSDVPLFLADGPVRMRGRGEQVERLAADLPPLFGVLVKPAVGVPTGPAYALLDALTGRLPGNASANLIALLEKPDVTIEALGAALHNDFERAVLPAFPAVAHAHRAVANAGAVRALLCGSGAAIFGLARSREHAREMTRNLCGRFPFVKLAESTSAVVRDGDALVG